MTFYKTQYKFIRTIYKSQRKYDTVLDARNHYTYINSIHTRKMMLVG